MNFGHIWLAPNPMDNSGSNTDDTGTYFAFPNTTDVGVSTTPPQQGETCPDEIFDALPQLNIVFSHHSAHSAAIIPTKPPSDLHLPQYGAIAGNAIGATINQTPISTPTHSNGRTSGTWDVVVTQPYTAFPAIREDHTPHLSQVNSYHSAVPDSSIFGWSIHPDLASPHAAAATGQPQPGGFGEVLASPSHHMYVQQQAHPPVNHSNHSPGLHGSPTQDFAEVGANIPNITTAERLHLTPPETPTRTTPRKLHSTTQPYSNLMASNTPGFMQFPAQPAQSGFTHFPPPQLVQSHSTHHVGSNRSTVHHSPDTAHNSISVQHHQQIVAGAPLNHIQHIVPQSYEQDVEAPFLQLTLSKQGSHYEPYIVDMQQPPQTPQHQHPSHIFPHRTHHAHDYEQYEPSTGSHQDDHASPQMAPIYQHQINNTNSNGYTNTTNTANSAALPPPPVQLTPNQTSFTYEDVILKYDLPFLCSTQNGARILQASIDTAVQQRRPDLIQFVFKKLLPYVFRLSFGEFSNYALQKLIDNLPSADSCQGLEFPMTPLNPPHQLHTPLSEWNDDLQRAYEAEQINAITSPPNRIDGTFTGNSTNLIPFCGLRLKKSMAPPLPKDPEISPHYYCLLMLRAFNFGAGLYSLATDSRACRTIQSILHHFAQANTQKNNPFVKEALGLLKHHIAPHAFYLSTHPAGNHVIQRCCALEGFLDHPIFTPVFFPQAHYRSLYAKYNAYIASKGLKQSQFSHILSHIDVPAEEDPPEPTSSLSIMTAEQNFCSASYDVFYDAAVINKATQDSLGSFARNLNLSTIPIATKKPTIDGKGIQSNNDENADEKDLFDDSQNDEPELSTIFPLICNSRGEQALYHQLFPANLCDGYHISIFTSLSTNNYACRCVQRIYSYCNDQQRASLLNQAIKAFEPLSTDVFGNYVLQHILSCGSQNDIQRIASLLKGRVYQLSMHKYASNVVERTLNTGNPAIVEALINELLYNSPTEKENSVIVNMVTDTYANYVLKTILTVTSSQPSLFNKIMTLIPPHLHNHPYMPKRAYQGGENDGPLNSNHSGRRHGGNNAGLSSRDGSFLSLNNNNNNNNNHNHRIRDNINRRNNTNVGTNNNINIVMNPSSDLLQQVQTQHHHTHRDNRRDFPRDNRRENYHHNNHRVDHSNNSNQKRHNNNHNNAPTQYTNNNNNNNNDGPFNMSQLNASIAGPKNNNMNKVRQQNDYYEGNNKRNSSHNNTSPPQNYYNHGLRQNQQSPIDPKSTPQGVTSPGHNVNRQKKSPTASASNTNKQGYQHTYSRLHHQQQQSSNPACTDDLKPLGVNNKKPNSNLKTQHRK